MRDWSQREGTGPFGEAEKLEHVEDLQKAVDGRNDLVWSAMQYGCRSCRSIEWIYIGVGVEGPQEMREKGLYIASPFGGPACLRCGGQTNHVFWRDDRVFPPQDPPPGVRYFKVPNKWTSEHMRYYMSSVFAGDTATAPGVRGGTHPFSAVPRAG